MSIPPEEGKDGKGFKNFCENYLFEDYRLKSVVAIWDPSLGILGRTYC
jgi:hypothetical protein